jgi:hypothetical protein
MRTMQPRLASSLIIVVAGFITTMPTAADAAPRSALERDVESYAIASCLVGLDQPYLKDQGDGWASVIIQRAKGGMPAFRAVAAAVKAELAKGNMAIIHSEEPGAKDKPLPVLYCAEIIDAPSVHAAIGKAVKKLSPAYRTQ